MRRISHDLAGLTQRIAKLRDGFALDVQAAEEVWKDAKGRTFFQMHTSEISSIINQLVSSMTQDIELFENIAKQVRDPQSD